MGDGSKSSVPARWPIRMVPSKSAVEPDYRAVDDQHHTADVSIDCLNQVMAAGQRRRSDLVRVTVNTEEAAAAVPEIVETWINSACACR